MNEKKANFIGVVICICIFLFAGTLGTALGLSCELESTRNELGQVRAELSAASDRQQQLTEVAERTGTILSQSAVTISDIRKQIREIRKSYEELENCLYNRNADSDNTVSNSNDSNF